jgi:small subunit ribosomal protein S6
MRTYELVLILASELESLKQEKIVADVESAVKDFSGKLVKSEKLGLKELAYPIKKKTQGVYWLFELKLDPSNIKKFEEKLYNMEEILRYLLVLSQKGEE